MKKLICVVALVILLSACGEKPEIKENDKVNEVIASEDNGENKGTELKDVILGEWKPVSAKDENDEDMDLKLIWGTGIRYGGTLNIYEDGTYTEYIGIIGETAPLEGSWETDGEQIILTSKTDDKKTIALESKDSIDVDYESYTVRFEKQKTLYEDSNKDDSKVEDNNN